MRDLQATAAAYEQLDNYLEGLRDVPDADDGFDRPDSRSGSGSMIRPISCSRARRWDSEDARRTNPDCESQIDLLAALVAESYRDGDRLLDLGVGSGLVEEALFERLPDIRVVGIDLSEAMLERARGRHRGRANPHMIAGGFEALKACGAGDSLGPP